MSIAVRKFRAGAVAAVVGVGLVLGGCQTSGKGATTGALIGGGVGCGVGAAVSHNAGTGCLIGGLFGAFAGAIIGDAIERDQQKKAVYAAMRSGRRASSGTFRNSQGQRVSYSVTPTRTYRKDDGRTCRDYEYSKRVNGADAGSRTDSQCQVRIAGKPTWPSPES